MLATIDDLKRYLRTDGTVRAGAAIDDALLEALVRASEARVRGELADRTLDVVPALVPAAVAGDPPTDTAEPVERRIPVWHGTHIVRVPDLRELVSVAPSSAGVPGDAIDLGGGFTSPTLIREPGQRTAIGLRFPHGLWADELVVVGRWGPAGVGVEEPLAPSPAVREAVVVWAARAYHNRTARYADTMQDPAGGVASYFRNLPPDVASTIEALRIPAL